MTNENIRAHQGNSHNILNRILSRSSHHDSLVMAIAEQVGLAIINGEMAPGDDLNSVDLSIQFETSRTPVREALLLLQKEGLVVVPPRRRPHVSPINMEDVRDIYQVRASLFGLVAELIVISTPDAEIALLEQFLEQMKITVKSNDFEAYYWLVVAFQDAEIAMCRNTHLKRILESLMLRVLRLRRISNNSPDHMQQSLNDHISLCQAYKEHNLEMAVALKRGIVLRGLSAIEISSTSIQDGTVT